jgi:hypothetical protein
MPVRAACLDLVVQATIAAPTIFLMRHGFKVQRVYAAFNTAQMV